MSFDVRPSGLPFTLLRDVI